MLGSLPQVAYRTADAPRTAHEGLVIGLAVPAS